MTGRRQPTIITLVACGQIDAVRKLIETGFDANGDKVDVNARGYLGSCAVMQAIEDNDLDMLIVLVEQGKAKLDVSDYMGRTALSRAKELEHDREPGDDKIVLWIEQKLAEKKNVAPSSQEPKTTTMVPSVSNLGAFSKTHEKDEYKDNQQVTPTHRR